MGGEGNAVGGQPAGPTVSGGVVSKGGSPSHFVLSGQKMQLLERMKAVRCCSARSMYNIISYCISAANIF